MWKIPMFTFLPWSLLVFGWIFHVVPMMVQPLQLLRQSTQPSRPCQCRTVTRPALLLLHGHHHQHQWKPSNRDTTVISGKRGSLLQSTGSNNDEATSAQAEYATEIEDLKSEITKYLQLRKEIGADDIAKEQVGKVIGGTKGNTILEFVSVSPNKPTVTTDQPNVLDYDELTKYGFGRLVTRIMKIGGRNKMYEIMNMDVPAIKPKIIKTAPKIVIDRDGGKGYQGLKLNQVLDDSIQGMALQNVQRKIELGQRLSASNEDFLEEIENFELPFADKRNVGPKQTPDWTVEQIDEWGKQQGRVESWARNAKLGAYVNDPMESLDTINLSQRFYSIMSSFLTAIAFGNATPKLLYWINHFSISNDSVVISTEALTILQVPSAILLLAAVGSSIYCGSQAPKKNRSIYVWCVKGLLGGPFTIQQFEALTTRKTQQEVLNDRQQEMKQDIVNR